MNKTVKRIVVSLTVVLALSTVTVRAANWLAPTVTVPEAAAA